MGGQTIKQIFQIALKKYKKNSVNADPPHFRGEMRMVLHWLLLHELVKERAEKYPHRHFNFSKRRAEKCNRNRDDIRVFRGWFL